MIANIIEQRGLFLMAASERDEKSWMYRHMRQSAFTRLLVDALNGQAHRGKRRLPHPF